MERHHQELLRLQDVIKLNSVLNALGIDNVREDFRAGRNTSLVSVKPLVPYSLFQASLWSYGLSCKHFRIYEDMLLFYVLIYELQCDLFLWSVFFLNYV